MRWLLEYMKLLYMNSELFLVSERLRFLSSKSWAGLIHMEGPRIIVGDNPILVGSFVSDLRFEPVSGAIQTVRWTQPAGIRRRPPENKAEYLGQPTEKTFRVTVGGDVSEIRDVAAFEYD
jgi:hypothetical protein